jgi:hypothetical protein
LNWIRPHTARPAGFFLSTLEINECALHIRQLFDWIPRKMDTKSTTATFDKIDVARIVMECPDGMAAKARVSTIQAANQILKSWIDTTPAAGNQVCNVQILFEDGLQYRSQVTLIRSRSRFCLARHLRKELTPSNTGKRRAKIREASDGRPSFRHAEAGETGKSVVPSLDRYEI